MDFITPFAFIVTVLAAYRLTRLFVFEDFPPIAIPRDWLEVRVPAWLSPLFTCMWCLGFWIGLACVAANYYAPTVWQPIAVVLSVNALIGGITRGVDGA